MHSALLARGQQDHRNTIAPATVTRLRLVLLTALLSGLLFGPSASSAQQQLASQDAPSITLEVKVAGEMKQTVRSSSAGEIAQLLSSAGNELRAALSGATWQPLIDDTVAVERLRQNAIADLGSALGDLTAYFRVTVPLSETLTADDLLSELNAHPSILNAYRAPIAVPPPTVPDFTEPLDENFDPALGRNVYQRAHDEAPTGLGVRQVSGSSVGRGSGVQICVVDYDFNPNHTDLPFVNRLGAATSTNIPPVWGEHGTAVLGQLGALDNGWGVVGIVPDADLLFTTAYPQNSSYNVTAAIATCAAALSPGDVLLIEQQTSGPNYTGSGQQGLVPVEWIQSAYDAVLLAVGAGIHVVAAAGNGEENLDDPAYSPSSGAGSHAPFLPANDSGSLIVGAGNSAWSVAARSRASFSNHGSTIDLQGIGGDTVSTGYGSYIDQGPDVTFTRQFGGTSGASGMVAGAVAVASAAWQASEGQPASVGELRGLLRDTGTPQNGLDMIGPQPDLVAALQGISATAQPPSPVITPTPGAYNMPIQVTIDYGTRGASQAIRYTLDGSEPTLDSFQYFPEQGDTLYLNYGITVKAKSFISDPSTGFVIGSETTTAIYESTTPKVATPVITPGAGSYSQPHQVTISTATPGATIRYRTDGRTPSFFYPGTLYDGPITLDPGVYEVTARGYKDGYYKSDAASSGEIMVSEITLPSPTIYPNTDTYNGSVTAYIGSTVLGADIRYTTDGSDPTESSSQFTEPLYFDSTTTLKARIYLDGYTPSATETVTYTIISQAAAPVISPNGNVGSTTVTMSTTSAGATIRYTTNGAEPTSYSTAYTGPFQLGVGLHTIKAKAFLTGATPSTTTTAMVEVFDPAPTVADPEITPFNTQYFVAPFEVTMRTDTQGATIRYEMTTDGTLVPDPTPASTQYLGPFTLSVNGQYRFKARAYKDGGFSNIIGSGTLSLGDAVGVTAIPTISLNGGVFENPVNVTLTAGQYETIIYTRDGSDPDPVPPFSSPSQQYNSPFQLNSPTTVTATAYRAFFANGGTSSADFEFKCGTPSITPAGGNFFESTQIELETVTSSGVPKIYFTLDGTDPDEASALYDGPIQLDQEGITLFKARCFRFGWQPSEVATAVFVVDPTPSIPQILQQPLAQSTYEGGNALFSVEAVADPAPNYQWLRDGTPIAGENEPVLVLNDLGTDEAGLYSVVIDNGVGEVESDPAQLSVEPALFVDGFESGDTTSWSNSVGGRSTDSWTTHSGQHTLLLRFATVDRLMSDPDVTGALTLTAGQISSGELAYSFEVRRMPSPSHSHQLQARFRPLGSATQASTDGWIQLPQAGPSWPLIVEVVTPHEGLSRVVLRSADSILAERELAGHIARVTTVRVHD